MNRWLIRVAAVLVALSLLLVISVLVISEPRPEGAPGPEADALARRIQAAVDVEAWERTAAVRWNFADRYEHLWDRRRQLARVKWEETVVWLDLTTKEGVAKQGGETLAGPAAEAALEKAYARWINDAFWLNPFA